MPWSPIEDQTVPFIDFETGGTIVAGYPAEDIRIDITPMLFNDRIVVTLKKDYPYGTVAGFCYDKGAAASLAAMHWIDHWEELDEPLGHKKVAFNDLPDQIGKGAAHVQG